MRLMVNKKEFLYRGGTGTGGSAGGGRGVCVPGVCVLGVRYVRVPGSRPGARRCHCRHSAWTRRRRRWSPGGRGLAGKADSSSAPYQTCHLLAPPPPPSPTTSLSTGATGLVRVSNRHYLSRETLFETQHTGSQGQLPLHFILTKFQLAEEMSAVQQADFLQTASRLNKNVPSVK